MWGSRPCPSIWAVVGPKSAVLTLAEAADPVMLGSERAGSGPLLEGRCSLLGCRCRVPAAGGAAGEPDALGLDCAQLAPQPFQPGP